MKRNQIVRKVGSVVFVVETDQTPSDSEWGEFLDIFQSYRSELSKLRVLVMTAGGAPNAGQRKQLAAVLGNVRFRVAVVSDNITVRFIASTIALFHRDHRSFSRAELSQAYDHLQLNPQERVLAETAIRQLLDLLA
jgi:hypothetical protein